MDMGEPGSVPDDLTEAELRGGVWWRHLVAGAVAGAVSRTCTAPLDRLKLMLMVGRGADFNGHGFGGDKSGKKLNRPPQVSEFGGGRFFPSGKNSRPGGGCKWKFSLSDSVGPPSPQSPPEPLLGGTVAFFFIIFMKYGGGDKPLRPPHIQYWGDRPPLSPLKSAPLHSGIVAQWHSGIVAQCIVV